MLKKALTTTVLATVLLTSSISANELATEGFLADTAKIEAFQGIPSQGLNHSELNEKGENWKQWATVGAGIIVGAVNAYLAGYLHGSIQR